MIIKQIIKPRVAAKTVPILNHICLCIIHLCSGKNNSKRVSLLQANFMCFKLKDVGSLSSLHDPSHLLTWQSLLPKLQVWLQSIKIKKVSLHLTSKKQLSPKSINS